MLTFLTATAGVDLTACRWEYFTYRTGPFGNCGSGCPSGMIKLVALAETNNGVNNNPCFLANGLIDLKLAQLKFLVANDRNLECSFVPVRFFWLDCTDNTLSNKRGDTLLVSHKVFDWKSDTSYLEIDQLNDGTLPSIYGAPDTCLARLAGTKGVPIRIVDYYNGGIDIICAKDVDDRGDINLNGVAYEIADAVMFTNYFIAGLVAFPHPNGSMAASDVNGDGITLSVADLVFLIRVVIGDATALPKDAVGASKVDAKRTYDNGVLGVDTKLAAAFVLVNGNVTPTLMGEATSLKLSYNYDADAKQTRILVAPSITDAGVSLGSGFTGDFLNLGANADVVSVDGATLKGESVSFKVVPKNFELSQNYPNPFNPTTTISFGLPTASSWTLNVYNVRGQLVKSYAGTDEAGTVTRVFDGANLASGMYFYKLTAGEYTSVKKMVMIK